MSYDDEDRRREYYREQARREEERARQRREDDERAKRRREDDERAARRQREDEEYSRLERERRDRNSEEGIAAIRKGDLAVGAMKLGLADFADNFLQPKSQSQGDTEGPVDQANRLGDAAPRTGAEIEALNQITRVGASQYPMVLAALRDRCLNTSDRIYMALLGALHFLDQQKSRAVQKQQQFYLELELARRTMGPVDLNYMEIENRLLTYEVERFETDKMLLGFTMQTLLSEQKALDSEKGE